MWKGTSLSLARCVPAVALGLVMLVQAPGAKADQPDSPGNSETAAGRVKKSAVPEIPLGGAAAALTLLLGGVAIAIDRRRRKSS